MRPSAPSPAQIRARVTAQVAAISSYQPGHSISVAALNTATGARFTAGATHGMWTASCYKLFALETLLLQHQRSGSQLSDGEVADATRAIEHSDNPSGYRLFLDVGGRPGLIAGARRLGLGHTLPGRTDPTFTTTGASDYVTLVHDLVGRGPLDQHSRTFVLHLMRNVEADQRWGVGTVAQHGTTFANKNGWLSIDDTNGPGEDDDGRWAVTSVGVLTVAGQQVLMAVFTQHQHSFDAGVQLVQRLARTIAPAVSR